MSHGGRWEAAGFAGDDVNQILAGVLKESKLVLTHSEEVVISDDLTATAVQYLSLNMGSWDFSSIIGTSQADGRGKFLSAFPRPRIFRKLEVQTAGSRPYECSFEGLVSASLGGLEIHFFAPYWLIEKSEYEPGKTIDVYVSALAYRVIPVTESDDKTVKIKEDHPLREIDPDVPDEMVVTMVGAAFYIPSDDFPDDAEYMARVDGVGKIEDCEHCAYVLDVTAMRLVEEDMEWQIPLIVDKSRLAEGYEPKVGDTIRGSFWLVGCLPSTLEKIGEALLDAETDQPDRSRSS